MSSIPVIGLINNVALLIALGVLYELVSARRDLVSPVRQVIVGFLMGGIGMAVMMNPWRFTEEIVFDARSILLSVGALFFGPIPAGIAAAITGAFRLYLGGMGAYTGLGVIVTSTLVGIVWRAMRKKGVADIGMGELALLGFVVHVFMILWMLTLPSPWNYKIIAKIWLPVLVLHPVGTIFLGKMLAGQFARDEAAKALEQSESKYRRIVDTANEGIWAMDENFLTTFVNQRMAEMLGYGAGEMIGRRVHSFMFEEDLTDHDEKMQDRIQGSRGRYERRFRHKDGRSIWTIVSAVALSDNEGLFKGSFAMLTDITELKRTEERLREYEKVVEGLDEMIAVVDRDYRYVIANGMFLDYRGLEREQLIGHLASEILDKEVFENVVKGKLDECLQGKAVTYELKCNYAELGERDLLISYLPIEGPAGVNRIACVLRDVTEAKHAEEELRTEREQLISIFESINEVILVIDPQSHEILYANRFTEDLYGKQLRGGNCYERLNSLCSPCGHCAMDKVVALQGKSYQWEYHNPVLKKDFLATDRMIKWSDGRDVKFQIGVDITERKSAEKVAAEHIRFQQILMDVIPIPVFFKDRHAKYLGCNEAFSRLFGLPKTEIVGKSVYELSPKHLADIYHTKDLELLSSGGIQTYEPRVRHADGTEHDVIAYKSTFPDGDGNVGGLIGVMIDITEQKESEQALKESEEKFRNLFDNAEIGMFRTRLDGSEILDMNDKFLKIFGWTREEMRGKSSVIHWADPHEREEMVRRLNADGRVTDFECKMLNKDREVRNCVTSLRLYRDQSVLEGSIMDTTDRKRAEEALQESEEKYRATFNNAAVGIDLVDLNGRFLRVNGVLLRFLGYSEEEVCSLTILDVTHPEDLAKSAQMHDALVRGETEGYKLEKRYIRNDGSVVWADTYVSAIRDSDGKHVAAVGVIVDTTKTRKLAEIRLRLATAVEQVGDTIVITDTQGTILYVNPAFSKITGYSREEAIGKNPRMLKSGQHDEEFYQRLWKTISSGSVWNGHLITKKKDGTFVEEEASISPIKDDSGEIKNYVAVKRDVTTEVSLQKQLFQAHKMEAIGTLAGGIAHDFNNLLQVTLGYSELLLAEKSDKDRDYADLQKIYQAALSGAELVRNLLTFSRKTEPNPLPINLNAEITHVEKLLHRTIPKMIDIRLDLAEDLERINADRAQIEQIIMNLAVNARDAIGEQGALTIRTENVTLDEEYCRLNAEAKPKDYVLLSVSDTGHGMDRETLQHIFEPFFTTKELGRGTGLGLAMVYGIVKQHGGHITCYSEMKRGTTFKLYFPALPSMEEHAVEETGIMPAFGTETVLLVDDEGLVRELGRRILTRSGYTVLTADNGEVALDVYGREKERIALVILDLIMPTMGGKDCLQKMLQLDPKARVLVASGYSADASTKECIDRGAKGFVPKPFRALELLRQVRRTLDET